jgi:hypothetical protein
VIRTREGLSKLFRVQGQVSVIPSEESAKHEALWTGEGSFTPKTGTRKLGLQSEHTYPEPWMIFICFTIVLFPDSPAPVQCVLNE